MGRWKNYEIDNGELAMIINGQICIDEYDLIEINGDYLIEKLYKEFDNGDVIQLSYYITDKKIENMDKLNLKLFNSLIGIIDHIDFELIAYSEMTIEELREDFKLGGHDIRDMIRGFDGYYLFMIINKVDINV